MRRRIGRQPVDFVHLRSSRFVTLTIASLAISIVGCSNDGARPLQGYIEGEYVRVAAQFPGTLAKLSVKRGDQVATGAQVFVLESENEAAARRQAEEQLRAAEARLANLKTGKRAPEVETVSEQLRQAQAARDLSAANLLRQQDLFRAGFVSRATLDDARTALKRDDALVGQLKASVETTKQSTGRPDEIRAADANVRAAREALAQSQWRLSQRAVATPAAGLVHDTYYVVGDFVPAGSPVAAILPPGNVKARFYVPETIVGKLKRGDSVSLACDGCGPPIAATIAFISDRVEFTPPVLYSKENRAKLVFLVEAKPVATTDAVRLKPGQPVDVTLPAS
jgi:HlyD family secretion protein